MWPDSAGRGRISTDPTDPKPRGVQLGWLALKRLKRWHSDTVFQFCKMKEHIDSWQRSEIRYIVAGFVYIGTFGSWGSWARVSILSAFNWQLASASSSESAFGCWRKMHVDLPRLRNAVSHVHAAAVIAAAKAGPQIRSMHNNAMLAVPVPQAMEIEEELNIKQAVSEGVWSSTCRGCLCPVHWHTDRLLHITNILNILNILDIHIVFGNFREWKPCTFFHPKGQVNRSLRVCTCLHMFAPLPWLSAILRPIIC